MKKKILIEGMKCNNCVGHVRTALEEMEGVSLLEVNLAEKYALVETEVDNSVLKEVIEDEGYDVVGIE